MKYNRISLVFIAVLLLMAHPGAARGAEAELELITDRPDFTESAAAVPPGHVQVELGTEMGFREGERELLLPLALLRVGLPRNLEARVGVPSASLVWRDDQPLEARAQDLELGLKAVLPGETGSLGLLGVVQLPVTTAGYSEQGVGLGLKGLWSVDLGARLELAGNLGLGLSGLGAEALAWEAVVSMALGIELTGWLGTFVETFALFDADRALPFWDGGFTFLVHRRVQLDAYAGVGLEGGRALPFLGAGASVLW
jgi:hypothetical protein